MLPVDCSTTFKIWLGGLFGQQLNGIGPLCAIYFSPTFVSVTLVFCRLTCPHEHLGWQLQDFTDLLWLHSWLSSSLGLLLWGNVLQFIPKFVFVSQRLFFFNYYCTLFTSETKTWKLSWSGNAGAYPTSFDTELILLLLHSRADLIHHVYQSPSPSSSFVLYLELYLHGADTLICS